MTTLKQYLKSNGFKTRFLRGERKDFYVYFSNKEHESLLKTICSYMQNFINYEVFKMYKNDKQQKILIQFNKNEYVLMMLN